MDTYLRDFEGITVDTTVIHGLKSDSYRGEINNLSIFHTNIKSANENLDELLVLLKYMNHSYDIIILTETFKIFDLDTLKIDNYKCFYNNSDINKNTIFNLFFF